MGSGRGATSCLERPRSSSSGGNSGVPAPVIRLAVVGDVHGEWDDERCGASTETRKRCFATSRRPPTGPCHPSAALRHWPA